MSRPGSTRNLAFEEPNLAFEQQNFAFESQNFDLRNSDNFYIKSYSITILSIVRWNMNEYNVIRGAAVKNSACRVVHEPIPIWVTELYLRNNIREICGFSIWSDPKNRRRFFLKKKQKNCKLICIWYKIKKCFQKSKIFEIRKFSEYFL